MATLAASLRSWSAGKQTQGMLFLIHFPMKNSSFAQRRMSRVVAACAWLGLHPVFSGSVVAQPVVQPELKPLVITPSRAVQRLTDALPHTTVLQRQDIEHSQAPDLLTLLQREAGLQVAQNGGRGTASSLFMRGSASLQTLVLIDGVPLTRQDATGSLGLEHLLLDQIERIEIVRGNVSAIHGSGAIGGVVQIFTRPSARAPSANVRVEAGARGSSKLHADINALIGATGATRLSAGITRDQTDGFSAINPTQVPAANPDRDGYRNSSAKLAITHQLAKEHELGISYQSSDGRYDFDSAFGAPTDQQYGRNRHKILRVFSDHRFTPDWRSQLSYAERSDRALDIDNGLFGFTSAAHTQVRQFQWSNNLALGAHMLLSAGLEQQRQSIDADDGFAPYRQKRNLLAWYVGLQGQLGAHQYQLNLRSDKASALKRETTAYLGYGWNFAPQWKLTASASSAFNIPPLGYLYYPFGGNPSLLPEKAKSAELGLQWSQASHVLRTTLFDTRSRNLFEFDLLTLTFANLSRTRNKGLEVSYSGKLGQADVRASLTAQDPKDSQSGQTLNRRAKLLGAMSLDLPWQQWQFGADLRFEGSRRDGATRLGGHEVLDLRMRYALARDISAYARIENLFDRRYQTIRTYNQTPRGVFVGLQWQPKF